MDKFLILFIVCISLFVILTYALICGNMQFHRNGVIGAIYRFFTKDISQYIIKIFRKLLPNSIYKKGSESCTSVLNYVIVVFFYCIYMFFIIVNLYSVFPKSDKLFSTPLLHNFLSFALLPWPWVILIMLQFIDPGVINERNVESYLKIYPCDNQLYKTIYKCRATGLPVVPRSRYCKYTKRRIAYVLEKD